MRILSPQHYKKPVAEIAQHEEPTSTNTKKVVPGPRTRRQAIDLNLFKKNHVPTIEKKSSRSATIANKRMKNPTSRKLLNLTCSKLLKQCGNIESGSVGEFVASWEHHAPGFETDPIIEDVVESS
ncbi:hypothetical protein AgCh_023816 [Apium graveolens]